MGRRYANFSTGTVLPAYGYVNLGGTYAIPGQGLTFYANLLNVFQSIGLEEGNPRTQVGTGNYFFARPILPRRFQAGIGYKF